MKRSLHITADQSHTVLVEDLNITYHSRHGAVKESQHVFIEAGLRAIQTHPNERIYILEMGLGTGLNAWLTWEFAQAHKRKIHYMTVELFPLDASIYKELNYVDESKRQQFELLHSSSWNEVHALDHHFHFEKKQVDIRQLKTENTFHLIYYDAFAPSAQPELWTQALFEKLYSHLQANGILVTYCSKSDVRRAMLAAGFLVEKLPGPPRKREMLRAKKVISRNETDTVV